MPIPRAPKPPLAFSILISPHEGGFDVATDPHHALIEETISDVVRGRVAIRTDRSTTIAAAINGAKPWTNQPIGPRRVKLGLLELAQVGAEQLSHANRIVEGYLYDTVVSAILGSMRERAMDANRPHLTLDDGPIPQLRTTTNFWWRDVGTVVVARVRRTDIRIRGIPRSEPFAAWGNARILSRFRRRLVAALAQPR